MKVLRKLQPRLYSIASSQKAVGESVHLTVAVVQYQPERSSHLHRGVCSTFLAERAEGNGKVPVFVHTAKHFRIPENPDTPTIMVGPGTGIAPFRAFLQERKALGAKGKNWLFFGNSRLLQITSIARNLKGGSLKACSPDSLPRFPAIRATKSMFSIGCWKMPPSYTSHRLENGAIFYVCGDAARMAKDVDTALHQIVEQVGSKANEQAKEYVDALKKERRYRKDVY